MTHKKRCACCKKENAYKQGYYNRISDGRKIPRFQCKTCKKYFSQATFDPAYYQKKRHLNYKSGVLLSSCMSMRRIALALGIHPITVARKLEYLAQQFRLKQEKMVENPHLISAIQFDELNTIEHTKCKPLSVSMAVSEKSRKIIGFRVSQMPATGHLARISRKKYGDRADFRMEGMNDLFKQLKSMLSPKISIKSDECSFYHGVVNRHFPQAKYEQHHSHRSSVAGQGELKKVWRDPLFYNNHTFAMLRANINRLVRKTWCTTKKVSRLIDHLMIYMWMHNMKLTQT